MRNPSPLNKFWVARVVQISNESTTGCCMPSSQILMTTMDFWSFYNMNHVWNPVQNAIIIHVIFRVLYIVTALKLLPKCTHPPYKGVIAFFCMENYTDFNLACYFTTLKLPKCTHCKLIRDLSNPCHPKFVWLLVILHELPLKSCPKRNYTCDYRVLDIITPLKFPKCNLAISTHGRGGGAFLRMENYTS